MGMMRLQIIVPAVSALNEDAITNVWHAETTGAVDTTVSSSFADAVTDVYQAISVNLSPLMNWPGMHYKSYDLGQPEPRPPIGAGTCSFTGTTGVAALPTECACVLSFQGDPQPGVAQARRRGRVYIGPLAVQSLNEPDGRLEVLLHQGLRDAGHALQLAGVASGTWLWSVYSATSSPHVMTHVTHGWVDNAYDTQRRRGVAATTRSSW